VKEPGKRNHITKRERERKTRRKKKKEGYDFVRFEPSPA